MIYIKLNRLVERVLPYFIIFVFAILFTNSVYHYGDDNHVGLIPYELSRQDKNYLANDFFVSYTREVDVRYSYVGFLLMLEQFMSREGTYYLLTIALNYFIFSIVYYSAELLVGKKSLAPYLSVLFLAAFYKFGNLGGAGALVDGFLLPELMAVPLVLLAYLFSIKGSFFKVLVLSIISLLIHPSVALVTLIPISLNILINKDINRRYMKIFLLLAINALLTFQLYIKTAVNSLTSQMHIYILANFRHPHHYIPSSFPLKEYINFIVLILLLLISIKYFIDKKFSHKVSAMFFLSLIGSMALLLIGYIFVELFPIRQIVDIQTFRIVFFIRYLFAVVIPVFLFNLMVDKFGKNKTHLLFTFLCGFFLLNSIYVSRYSLLKPETAIFHTENLKIYDYIKDNTPSDSIFLVPPYFSQMRLIPKRSIVVDLKTFPFKDQWMCEWYKRVRDIYGSGPIAEFDEGYKKITDDKLVWLKNKYNFSYAILHLSTETKFQLLYSDDKYKLVSVK